MQIFECRIRVPRSNPQIVRVFRVDGEWKVKQFLAAIRVVMGFAESQHIGVLKDGSPVEEDGTISSLIKVGDVFEVRLPNAEWHMELTVSDVLSDGEPELIRTHGFHPPVEIANLTELNSVLGSFAEFSGRSFLLSRYHRADYLPDTEEISAQLSWVGKNPLDGMFDLPFALPAEQFLRSWSLDNMIYQIRKHKLMIYPTNSREATAEDLCHLYGSRDFVASVLWEMSLMEYKALVGLMEGKIPEKADKAFPVLTDYWMILPAKNGGGFYILREFLNAFSRFLYAGEEDAFLNEKVLNTVVLAGCRLYGVMTEKRLQELLAQNYPDMEGKLRIAQCANHPEIEFFGGYAFTKNLTRAEAGQLAYAQGKRPAGYLFTAEELEKTALEGLGFTEETNKTIREWAAEALAIPAYYHDHIVNDVYIGMQKGNASLMIAKSISRYSRLGQTSPIWARFARLLDGFRNQVRVYALDGAESNNR